MENLGTNLKNERLQRSVQKARLQRQAVKMVLDHFEAQASTGTLPRHEADNGDLCYRFDPATAFPAAQQGAACCNGGVCNEHMKVCPTPAMWRETKEDQTYVLGAMHRMSNLFVSVDADGIVLLTDKPLCGFPRVEAAPTSGVPTSRFFYRYVRRDARVQTKMEPAFQSHDRAPGRLVRILGWLVAVLARPYRAIVPTSPDKSRQVPTSPDKSRPAPGAGTNAITPTGGTADGLTVLTVIAATTGDANRDQGKEGTEKK